MKNLRITNIVKDIASLTSTGAFKLLIKFEVTGTDGSEESKVLFAGQYRQVGREPMTIYSDNLSLAEEAEHWAIIPAGEARIPNNAEVSILGMIDTDYKTYTNY